MSGRYAVLLRDAQSFNVVAASKVYAEIAGMAIAQASRKIRDCGGIIDKSLTEKKADILAGRLTAGGMPAFVMPAADLAEFPEAELCRKGSKTENGFFLEKPDVSDGRRIIKRFRIIADNIMVVVCGRVREKEKYKETEVHREVSSYMGAGCGMSGPVVRTAVKTVTKERDVFKYYLDICAIEPTAHCRIAMDTFAFRSFGLGLAPTKFQNFANLAGWVKSIATQAFVDKSIMLVLDGDPKTNLNVPSMKAYDNYIFWATQMAYLP